VLDGIAERRILVEDKGDSCRWWSIGEERGIAKCDRDKLEALTRKSGRVDVSSMVLVPVWYNSNAGWLAFLVSRIANRVVFSELAEEYRDGGHGIVDCCLFSPQQLFNNLQSSSRNTSIELSPYPPSSQDYPMNSDLRQN